MDVSSVLPKIRENLNKSFEEKRKRHDVIFIEFHRLLAEKGSTQANEYLAFHIGELDPEFSVYHTALASKLREKGLVQAANSMENLGKLFLENRNNFRTQNVGLLVKSAEDVAVKIASRYKTSS